MLIHKIMSENLFIVHPNTVVTDAQEIGPWPGDKPTNAVCIIKVSDMTKDEFLTSIEKHIIEVIDLRET
jgi:hypothetical protein